MKVYTLTRCCACNRYIPPGQPGRGHITQLESLPTLPEPHCADCIDSWTYMLKMSGGNLSLEDFRDWQNSRRRAAA